MTLHPVLNSISFGGQMNYQPLTCVWEITEGCNMRCGHCGSSCTEAKPDELSTDEALDLCDQTSALGLKWVTLSGGEPLTRKDWPSLVKRLSMHGVTVNIITNGWLIDDGIAEKMEESAVSTIAISIDGMRETHDQIRKSGAYDHASRSFSILKRHGILAGAVTTVSKKNIGELPLLKEELIAMGVDSWQLQLGLPMGNFAGQTDWLLEPEQMDDIIDFCYNTSEEGRIKVFPADCIGYYSKKDLEVRQRSFQLKAFPLWDGCNAGIRSFGVLQNGDIIGCTSIRSSEYIEGNIRTQALAQIWEDDSNFLWRRTMKKELLSGHCQICKYGSKCLGGCPNTRMTIHKSMYGENDYCSYNLFLKRRYEEISHMSDPAVLFEQSRQYAQSKDFQQAAMTLDRLIQLDPDHLEAQLLKGYAEFMLGNYAQSETANQYVLNKKGEDLFARKGLGLSYYRSGKISQGISELERAAGRGAEMNADNVHDLAVVYLETDQKEKARGLLNSAAIHIPDFPRSHQNLWVSVFKEQLGMPV